jgi:hypothetical protein
VLRTLVGLSLHADISRCPAYRSLNSAWEGSMLQIQAHAEVTIRLPPVPTAVVDNCCRPSDSQPRQSTTTCADLCSATPTTKPPPRYVMGCATGRELGPVSETRGVRRRRLVASMRDESAAMGLPCLLALFLLLQTHVGATCRDIALRTMHCLHMYSCGAVDVSCTCSWRTSTWAGVF